MQSIFRIPSHKSRGKPQIGNPPNNTILPLNEIDKKPHDLWVTAGRDASPTVDCEIDENQRKQAIQ